MDYTDIKVDDFFIEDNYAGEYSEEEPLHHNTVRTKHTR